MYNFLDLEKSMRRYLNDYEVQRVHAAYEFSARAHAGQQRLTGEPYIHHPLEVAGVLADMHMDYQTIMAAILHDVIEDTPISKEELQATISFILEAGSQGTAG